MKQDYKVLRFISLILKVLAVVGLIGIIFTTIANIRAGGMRNPNPAFALFNALFPFYIGILQAMVLYGAGELIIMFIEIKKDISRINDKISK